MGNKAEKIYETVLVPTAINFYAPRVIKQNGMCRCPIHEDSVPSCKISDRYFFCFACGAKGGVIRLVQDLFQISRYQAIKKLEQDFSIGNANPDFEKVIHNAIEHDKKEQKKTIRRYSDLIADKLLLLRTNCALLSNKELLSEKELTDLSDLKNEIKTLETLYIGLNDLSINETADKTNLLAQCRRLQK